MKRVISVLTEQLGVFRTWASFGRVAAWVVVWTLALSAIVAPRPPRHTDRVHEPDDPPSDVRYLGPTSLEDYAGFIAPDHDREAFTVAWIGGSEVKLRGVSVPGELSRLVGTVGGRRLQLDAYTVVAPRPIDALRAMESALANGADAVVVSLNPVWIKNEWSMREWTNLDVANLGTLWNEPSSLPWALALTSPADVGWRVTRAAFGLVEAQARLNARARRVVDALDVIARPADPPPSAPPDPRLPADGTSFWLVQEHGPAILDDVTVRVAAMLDGLGESGGVARYFVRRLVETAESSGVPVFLYAAPFSHASLADPAFAPYADLVEAYWRSVAAEVRSPLVEIEPRSLSRDLPDTGSFLDIVHMADARPIAELLARRLCATWRAADPRLECA